MPHWTDPGNFPNIYLSMHLLVYYWRATEVPSSENSLWMWELDQFERALLIRHIGPVTMWRTASSINFVGDPMWWFTAKLAFVNPQFFSKPCLVVCSEHDDSFYAVPDKKSYCWDWKSIKLITRTTLSLIQMKTAENSCPRCIKMFYITLENNKLCNASDVSRCGVCI